MYLFVKNNDGYFIVTALRKINEPNNSTLNGTKCRTMVVFLKKNFIHTLLKTFAFVSLKQKVPVPFPGLVKH